MRNPCSSRGVFLPLVRAFDSEHGPDYHLFIAEGKKTPRNQSQNVESQDGQRASSIGRGRATFIPKSPKTSDVSIITTVEMGNFLMRWIRLRPTMDARVPMSLPRTWV
jgi:hypothetical protein